MNKFKEYWIHMVEKIPAKHNGTSWETDYVSISGNYDDEYEDNKKQKV